MYRRQAPIIGRNVSIHVVVFSKCQIGQLSRLPLTRRRTSWPAYMLLSSFSEGTSTNPPLGDLVIVTIKSQKGRYKTLIELHAWTGSDNAMKVAHSYVGKAGYVRSCEGHVWGDVMVKMHGICWFVALPSTWENSISKSWHLPRSFHTLVKSRPLFTEIHCTNEKPGRQRKRLRVSLPLLTSRPSQKLGAKLTLFLHSQKGPSKFN